MVISFKTYLEQLKQQNYLDVLATEFGIEPEDLAKIPQVASFIALGDTYSLTPYEMTGIERDERGNVKGIKVKVMHDAASATRKRFIKKGDGQYVQVDDDQEPEDKEYLVPIDDILKMLTQGQEPQAQQPGMPGMGMDAGGMPGGMPGMGM